MAKRINQNLLNGTNPLSYMGVDPSTPPNQTIQNRAPTLNDTAWSLGTLWIVTNTIEVWFLAKFEGGSAHWIQIYPNNVAGATSFPTNSGTATEVNGVLNVLGTNVTQTSGSGNTVTIELTNSSNGQVLIGGGSQPLWKNITSNDGTVIINNGPNTIDLSVTGGESIHDFITDSGTATVAAGQIDILGGELINTSGSTNIVVVNLDSGDDGEIPIAATGAPTIYANITSIDTSIDITNGANTIDLSADGGGVPSGVSAFFYYQGSNLVVGVGTSYLGAGLVMTSLFDVNTNCTTGNGAGTPAIFTAPSTGIYLLGMGMTWGTGAANILRAFISTPSGNIYIPYPTSSLQNSSVSSLVSLTSGQTVQFGYVVTSGTTIRGGNGTPYWPTYFWGYQVS